MGLNLFFRDFGEWDQSEISNTVSNPDPNNFKIKKIKKIGKYLWILVNYPGCTTYRGDKILIYKNISIHRIKMYKNLDPHFSETGLTPVARFRPDPEGVSASIKFCENC